MKDLHESIKDEKTRPADFDDNKWAKLNQKTMNTIRSWINQSVYHHVVKKFKADGSQRKLKTIYEQPTAQNKANWMKRLFNLKYKEGCSITEHTSELQEGRSISEHTSITTSIVVVLFFT